MKRILVTGADGMLGRAVVAHFRRSGYDVRSVTRKVYDIAKDPLEKFIPLTEGVDVVVNCAGVIKPRSAQMSLEDVLRVNSIFPRNLGQLLHGRIRGYHITTDCVYSGAKGNYTELDTFDATDVYGMSKNGGDSPTLMTLRTSIIGEEQGQGRSLLAWAQSQRGKEVNGFTNHVWNGVTTVCLAGTIERMESGGLYQPGIFHIHSPNRLTKYELLQQMSEVYELGLRVRPTAAAEPCDRSLASVHNLSGKLVTTTIKEQLVAMRAFFAGGDR